MREGDAASFPPRQPRSKRYAPQNMTVHVMQPFLGESLNPCAPDTRPNTWPAAQSSSANADPSVSAGSAAPAIRPRVLPPASGSTRPNSSQQGGQAATRGEQQADAAIATKPLAVRLLAVR